VAYLTCPWCLAPQQVDDGAPGYQCITCYGEVKFFKCPHCGLVQTVNNRWEAFTCEQCEEKVDLPHRWGYSAQAKAGLVRGTGQTYPKF
jgi:hypothetical protein